ncbi:MAG: alpha/beta hydrolase [Fimbriimonadales bacterium]|nr:alpha/beta hydrolase [Fimbriimonadales bacterium]
MPATPRALNDAAWSEILDREGHEPCQGVAMMPPRLIRESRAGEPDQHAVVFRSAEPPSGPMPGVLALHGGGYCMGDPYGMGALAKALALALGVTTVSASYRLGSADRPTGPAILADAAHAWNWLHEHTGELGIDADRIGIAGESAGCLLAGHLAVGSPLTPASARPKAFLAFWGPLDLVARWYDNGQSPGAEVNILGPGGFPAHPGLYHALSPLAHAAGAALPPALFVYGENDQVVQPRQAALACAQWSSVGAHAEVLLLTNIGHRVEGDNRAQRRRLLERSIDFVGRWLFA